MQGRLFIICIDPSLQLKKKKQNAPTYAIVSEIPSECSIPLVHVGLHLPPNSNQSSKCAELFMVYLNQRPRLYKAIAFCLYTSATRANQAIIN